MFPRASGQEPNPATTGCVGEIQPGALMRHLRTILLLTLVAVAFTACKKGKGYMTEPGAAHSR